MCRRVPVSHVLLCTTFFFPLQIQHAPSLVTASSDTVNAAAIITPCLEAIITVAVDFVGVVLTAVSFASGPPAWAKVSNSLKGLLRTTGSNWLEGWKVLVNSVKIAATSGAKLLAVGKLVSQIFSQGGSLILKAFKDNMAWYDW